MMPNEQFPMTKAQGNLNIQRARPISVGWAERGFNLQRVEVVAFIPPGETHRLHGRRDARRYELWRHFAPYCGLLRLFWKYFFAGFRKMANSILVDA